MSFKAWSGLVLSLCCYAAIGCGEDNDEAGDPSAAAGENNSGTAGTESGGTAAGAASMGGKGGSTTGGKGGSATGGKGGSASGGSGGKGGNGTAGQSTTGGNASGGSGGAPAATDGCKVQKKPATGKQSIDVDGTTRSYYLIASEVEEPVPLYLGFHGYGGNGEGDQWTFNLQSLAGGKGVFMFPDGVVQTWWQDAIGWDNRDNDNPDMDLVKGMIAEAKSKHCIDTSRIYVMGFSWGGWMATQVACALGDQLRAFVSVAGGGPMNNTNCKVTSGLIMHGTNDDAENISSGRTSRDNFAKLNMCGTTTKPVSDNHCVAYDGCKLPVWWCEHNGGHHPADGWGQGAIWEFFETAPPH